MFQKEFLIQNNLTHTKRRITEASWKLLAHHERAKWTVLGDAAPKSPIVDGQESFQPQKLRVSTPPLEVINKGAVEKNPAYTKEADPDDAGKVIEKLPDGGTTATEPAAAQTDAGAKQTTDADKATGTTGTDKPTASKPKNPNRP